MSSDAQCDVFKTVFCSSMYLLLNLYSTTCFSLSVRKHMSCLFVVFAPADSPCGVHTVVSIPLGLVHSKPGCEEGSTLSSCSYRRMRQQGKVTPNLITVRQCSVCLSCSLTSGTSRLSPSCTMCFPSSFLSLSMCWHALWV